MKSNRFKEEMYEDNLLSHEYIGIIEDIDDPQREGKVRARVFSKFGHADDSENLIPTNLLPWAYPEMGHIFSDESGAGNFSAPRKGAKVLVKFDNDIYFPKYSSLLELSTEMMAMLGDDYNNSHVLLFDLLENLKLYYTVSGGLIIDNKGSIIRINNDNSILISHKNQTSQIELRENDIDIVSDGNIFVSAPNNIELNTANLNLNGAQTNIGANPIFSNMSGEPMMILLKILATGLDAKVPVTPSQFVNVVNQFEEQILSGTVTTSP